MWNSGAKNSYILVTFSSINFRKYSEAQVFGAVNSNLRPSVRFLH